MCCTSWHGLDRALVCAAVCSYATGRAATAAEARVGCDRGGDGGGGDNGGGNRGDGDGGDSSGRGDGAAKVRRERPSAAGCTAFMLLCALPTQQTVCMIVHVVRCAPSPPWLLRETATDSITKMGNFDRSKLDCPFHRFEIRASGAVRVVSLRRIGCLPHNAMAQSGIPLRVPR